MVLKTFGLFVLKLSLYLKVFQNGPYCHLIENSNVTNKIYETKIYDVTLNLFVILANFIR